MPEPGTEASARVIRLHEIRTLVIARDLAFRQRALTVFGELGAVAFAVGALNAADEVIALIARERAHVVVLDTTGCASAVAPVVYELSQLAPSVGVVLVSNRGEPANLLPTLEKWGWAEDLSRAVQQAYRRGNPLKEEANVHQQPC